MIAIVEGCGTNFASLRYALQRLGVEVQVTASPKIIREASHVILPGVGHASYALRQLQQQGLITLLGELTQPLLGICLGMQLFYTHLQECEGRGLGLIEGEVKRFPDHTPIVPHMGWNQLCAVEVEHPLLKGIHREALVYFVHSYRAPVDAATIATANYGEPFSAIVAKRNFFGMQFHPEKSGRVGAQVLKNFLALPSPFCDPRSTITY